jgi:Holliday junction resolvasome RuvABC endonuclease subunit
LALIDEFHPDEVALEAPFFGKRAIYAQTRKSARCGNGWQAFIVKFLLQNILPKSKNGNYWKW